MTEPHRTFDQQQAVESHAPYLTVFFVLLNFTLLEYLYATFHQSGLFLALYLIAACTAVTVVTGVIASFFHLHYNVRWIALTGVPAVLLSFVPLPLILGLMILAITKAALVGIYFMHLKYEGNWVYFMLVPAAFLAAVFIFALYPDIGMQPQGAPETIGEEEVLAVPERAEPLLHLGV
jgi:hypothetical protein